MEISARRGAVYARLEAARAAGDAAAVEAARAELARTRAEINALLREDGGRSWWLRFFGW
jgi:hypothetical protein